MLVPHPRTFLSLLSLLPLSRAATGSFALEDALAPSSIFSDEPIRFEKRALGQAWNGKTTIAFAGASGVGAM